MAAVRTASGLVPAAQDMQGLAGHITLTRLVRARRPATRTFAAALAATRRSEFRPALLVDLAQHLTEHLLGRIG